MLDMGVNSWICHTYSTQCKLVHTLGIPLAPSFLLEICVENLQYPSVISCRVFSPRKDDGTDFGWVWIQPNGVVAHVQVKGYCIGESFVLILGIGKKVLTLLFTSPKLLRKRQFYFSLVLWMMAMPTQTLAVALVPPVYIVSLFFWWGLPYVF